MMKRSVVVIILPALFALACTQHRLRVVDRHGEGLNGVDVHGRSNGAEPWRMLGITGDSGGISVPSGGVEDLRFVSLARVTRVLRVADLEDQDSVVLLAQPLLVPELTIQSPRVACSGSDDSLARGLWERAAEPHRGAWDTVGLAAYGLFHGGPVSFGDRIRPPQDSSRGRVMALGKSHAIDDNIREHGYAWEFPPGLRGVWEGQDFGYWYYPRFGLFNAYHLTSRLFGELNRLVLLHQRADEVQIAFCSVDQERPYVIGVLTIRDGDIFHAIWRFSTPRPVENAGGEATFQDNPRAAILTPAVSVYWRSRGFDEQYLQRRFLVIRDYLLETHLRADQGHP